MLYQLLFVGLISFDSVIGGKIIEKPNLNREGKGKSDVCIPIFEIDSFLNFSVFSIFSVVQFKNNGCTSTMSSS